MSVVLITLSLAAAPGASSASDWPHFRGPNFDATGSADWPAEATLEVAWKVPLGAGHSGVVVAGGRAYTCFADETADWLAAFDAADGAELWRVRLGDPFPALAGGYGGPNATPALGEGLVFAVGGHGALVAVRPEGEEVWRRDLTEWSSKPDFGFASSPIVLRDREGAVLVIQAPSSDGKILYGLDPATGKELWSSGEDTSAFQTPVWTRLAGEEQIVVSGDTKLRGVTARGEILWTFDFQNPGPPSPKGRQVNVPLPIGNDRIVVRPSAERVVAVEVRRDAACGPSGHDAGDRCRLHAEEVWSSNEFGRTYVPSSYAQGSVFGRKGPLGVALDAGDDGLLWRSRSPGDGFTSATDDRLLVMTKRGSLHLGRTGSAGLEEQSWLRLFDDASWTEPTIAEGSVFVRSMGELARVEVRPGQQAEGSEPGGATEWIDVTRFGAALPDTNFGRFVRSLRDIEERGAAIDKFLAGIDSFPIVEGDWAHFVYRGPEENVGISGDMVGERTEFDMPRVPGTDLFYFSSKLPRDARVSYVFYTVPGDAGILDPLNPRETYWPREGSEFDREKQKYSQFSMPRVTPPSYLAGEVGEEGRIETHIIDFADLGLEAHPAPIFAKFVPREMPSTRRIRVYVPGGYDASREEPYPLVLVFAGDKVLEGLDAKDTLDHLLGDELPAAVVVFVDRHFELIESDASWAFEMHRRTLFDRVLPWLRSNYDLGQETYYLGFGYGGPIVLATAKAPESTAPRIAMVQTIRLRCHQAEVGRRAGSGPT